MRLDSSAWWGRLPAYQPSADCCALETCLAVLSTTQIIAISQLRLVPAPGPNVLGFSTPVGRFLSQHRRPPGYDVPCKRPSIHGEDAARLASPPPPRVRLADQALHFSVPLQSSLSRDTRSSIPTICLSRLIGRHSVSTIGSPLDSLLSRPRFARMLISVRAVLYHDPLPPAAHPSSPGPLSMYVAFLNPPTLAANHPCLDS